MKKLLSLILCLMLALPAFALAESTTVDFGTFTMDLGPNDEYQVSDSLVNNQVYAYIYPAQFADDALSGNINAVWCSRNIFDEVKQVGSIDAYAQAVLKQSEKQFNALGVVMSNATVLNTSIDDNVAATLTSFTLDYTGAGSDLIFSLYQMQVMYYIGEGGSYIFTVTALTQQDIQTMAAYLDTLNFKAAAPAELSTVDFGYFTMGLTTKDYYQVAAERQENQVYALIYPNYDAPDSSPININVVWSATDFSLQVKLFGANLYTQSVLKSTSNLYQSMGYTLSNQAIHEAVYEDSLYSTTFSYDLTSGSQSLTLYQKQNYYFCGENGVYAFTLTANSLEELAAMDFYFDHIVIK